MNRIILALALCLSTPAGLAKDPLVLACIREAARDFQVAELPLNVLYEMEGGSVGHTSQNTNGTFDVGPMQINSSWLKILAPSGITFETLRDDACTNVYVGTWIFAQEWTRSRGDIAMAIARYHSPTPKYQARYLRRVSKILDAMIEARSTTAGEVASVSEPSRATVAPSPAPTDMTALASTQVPSAGQGLQFRSISQSRPQR